MMENKTPKKKRRSGQDLKSPENSKFERFIDSPGRSPSQGNLTGTARKIKDAAADWHNSIQKWSSFVGAGSDVISQIANMKLERLEVKADDSESSKRENEMPSQLGPLCDKLLFIYENMVKIVKKMDSLTSMLKGVSQLEKHQKGDSDEPMFLTWPANKFYEASNCLSEMYAEELKLKQTIMENVAHTNNRDVMMLYSAAWVHEPYIEDQSKTLLEAMLLETGHR